MHLTPAEQNKPLIITQKRRTVPFSNLINNTNSVRVAAAKKLLHFRGWGQTGLHEIINTCWADLTRFATFNFVVPEGGVEGENPLCPMPIVFTSFPANYTTTTRCVRMSLQCCQSKCNYAVMFRFDGSVKVANGKWLYNLAKSLTLRAAGSRSENAFTPNWVYGARIPFVLLLFPAAVPASSNFKPADDTTHSNSNLHTHTFKSVGKDNNDGNHNDSRYRINSTVEEKCTVG